MLTVIGQFKLAQNGEYRLTLTPEKKVICKRSGAEVCMKA